MAKFTLKFLDVNHLSCDKSILVEKIQIENLILIELTNNIKNQSLEILLDKSTAIKFAKTLRTEINKIVE